MKATSTVRVARPRGLGSVSRMNSTRPKIGGNPISPVFLGETEGNEVCDDCLAELTDE